MLTVMAVTRSNKANDRNHAALADGSAVPDDRLPRYFAKSGHVDADPKKIKKEGSGSRNWHADPLDLKGNVLTLHPQGPLR